MLKNGPRNFLLVFRKSYNKFFFLSLAFSPELYHLIATNKFADFLNIYCCSKLFNLYMRINIKNLS